jgi:hypothetical protein
MNSCYARSMPSQVAKFKRLCEQPELFIVRTYATHRCIVRADFQVYCVKSKWYI